MKSIRNPYESLTWILDDRSRTYLVLRGGIAILSFLGGLGRRGVFYMILLTSGGLLAIAGLGHLFPYYDTCPPPPPRPGPVLCFHTDYSLSLYAQIFGLIFALAGANGLIRSRRPSENKSS